MGFRTWFELDRIKSDWFLTDFHQTKYKRFFELFGNRFRNSFDSFGLNSFPKLSSGEVVIDLRTFSFTEKNYISDIRFIRIISDWIESSQIDFWLIFTKQNTKSLSDWFGVIPNGSVIDFQIALICSDSIPFWNFRQGKLSSIYDHLILRKKLYFWHWIHSDWLRLEDMQLRSIRVWIYSDLELDSDWIESSRIDFWPIFIKRNTKSLSDWFGMNPNGSGRDFKIAPIRSDWIPFWNFRHRTMSSIYDYLILRKKLYFRPRIHADQLGMKIRFISIRAWIDSDLEFGLNWIESSRIDFWSIFTKRDKSFSDWFGMIPSGSGIDFKVALIRSYWIPSQNFR